MPVASYMMYAVRFNLPDRDHLASFRSLKVTSDDEKRWLVVQVQQALVSNPDAKIVDVIPLDERDPHAHLAELAQKLNEEYPDQPGAHEIGLDYPNRILHDVEIPRSLAAMRVPGGAAVSPEAMNIAGRSASARAAVERVQNIGGESDAPTGAAG